MPNRWDYGLPSPPIVYGAVLKQNVSIGTTATSIGSVNVQPGLYIIRCVVLAANGGPATLALSLSFNGQAPNIAYSVTRYTATAPATTTHTAFEGTPSNAWIKAVIDGSFLVDVSGDLSFSATRSGGGSSTIGAGSFLTLVEAD